MSNHQICYWTEKDINAKRNAFTMNMIMILKERWTFRYSLKEQVRILKWKTLKSGNSEGKRVYLDLFSSLISHWQQDNIYRDFKKNLRSCDLLIANFWCYQSFKTKALKRYIHRYLTFKKKAKIHTTRLSLAHRSPWPPLFLHTFSHLVSFKFFEIAVSPTFLFNTYQ